jgi:ElaB/YqjD/DUF883 family membrane-anchored ribosome-binding protein
MNTTDKVNQFAQDAVDTITNASHQAKETFNDKSEQLLHAERLAAKNCRGYIRTNPVTSIGIAVAAGFFLGGLLGASRR